ncbi:MAG: HAMP domain-containing sensor histidine kinase [Acidimicrobiia bacterium]|nr:HAMP domain-containing sensor histidine kinase [Acidimicrobiia bacterium]
MPISELVDSKRNTVARWGIYGFLFGALFPAIGWTAATRTGAQTLADAHAAQPVLWIVDLAPFVLAMAGFLIGIQQAKLAAALKATDQKVHDRTRELRVANDRLQHLIQSKDQFLATVSHELRTPLTVVCGFAQELLDDEVRISGLEAKELIGVIADQSHELSNIIEDLLVAARADIGAVSISKVEVDVAAEAEMVVSGCVCTKDERASIRLDLEPAVAEIDPTRLRQIVRNLLTNAIRYGGPVRSVETRTSDGVVTIRVRDNGRGIPVEDRERVFEPYQSTGAERGVSGSVGLGLTVSRKLATLMGGDLSYTYDDGISTFVLSFPALESGQISVIEGNEEPSIQSRSAFVARTSSSL